MSNTVKKAGVMLMNKQSHSVIMNCKVIEYVEIGKDFLVKLKPPKQYAFGHEYIWRQLDELF